MNQKCVRFIYIQPDIDMTTLEQKASISFGSAVLFAIINLPQTYQVTDSVLGPVLGPLQENGCPTAIGLLVHTLVFGLVSFLSMGDPTQQTGVKAKYSLYGALIFFFLSSPTVYSIVGSIFGTSSPTGCPTLGGVMLHALIYFLALTGVMYLPSDKRLDS